MRFDTFVLFFNALSALTDAFVFCYFGAMTTIRFAKYADRLYEVHWYNLPTPLQKQLIAIMPNLQRPLYYRGLGMVTLDLVTFVNVKFNTCIHI